jgi:arylsulfatase A-like enzyme
LQLSAVSLLASVGGEAVRAGQEAKRPNILFLLSDDQRPDTIGALGNSIIKTPHLDRLCARGTAFTNAHIMGGMNGAICIPSRAAILTGRTLFRCPEQPVDVPVWPATFARAGYTTFQTGKWHNGPASLHHAFESSRRTFFGGMGDHSKIPLFDMRADRKYPKEEAQVGDRYDAEIFTDSAVRFIQEQKGDQKPWFAWVSFTNPHDPRTPPGDFAKMYDPASMPLPRNYMERPPLETGLLNGRDEKLLPVPRTAEDVRRELAAYYGSISHLDQCVGSIVEALRASGQLENTIVIFAGDNGLALGSHGLLGKQNVYEHSVGVPLVMVGPGIAAGRRSDAMVYLLDLFPTVAELCGVDVPGGVEGRSMAPMLHAGGGGPGAGGRETLFFAYQRLSRGVRDRRWKLIEWTVRGNRTIQLFDLQDDPDELKDLAGDPAHEPHRRRLEDLLARYKKELGDPTVKNVKQR